MTSAPPGAVVLRAADEMWLGQTPMSLQVPRARGVVQLELRLRGFEPERVSLATDVDVVANVTLRRTTAHPSASEAPATSGLPRAKAAPPAAPPPASSSTPAPAPAPKLIGNGYLDPFGAGRNGTTPPSR